MRVSNAYAMDLVCMCLAESFDALPLQNNVAANTPDVALSTEHGILQVLTGLTISSVPCRCSRTWRGVSAAARGARRR